KDGKEPFAANALAKAKQATPFKRPENGEFRPASGFKEFVFTETGDTTAKTEAGSELGGFGALMHLTQVSPDAAEGTIAIAFRGDVEHTGLDNLSFWDRDRVFVVEDAGDGLHSERKGLDSGYLIDLTADYSQPGTKPIRILAEGRDAL